MNAMQEEKSRDLQNGYWSVENPEAWLKCPHCGSENVYLEELSPYSDLRTTVDCQDCEACGFYD